MTGASAYFTAAEPGLDPALFSGDMLKPEIRDYVLGHLGEFFAGEGIKPGPWLHAWLAGSGASYQWKASRGNGDLDILLGIGTGQLSAQNPAFASASRTQLAADINEQMKLHLWPATAAAHFGDSVYEVTYYWNPEVNSDITVIRPYAAWNLGTSRWDIRPDPQPVTGFPQDWRTRANEDTARVASLHREWAQHLADVQLLPAAAPGRSNAEAGYRRVTAELRSIWDVLHDGRRSAFTRDGAGWGDWHNYRWQAAKASGTAALLRDVITTDSHRTAENDTMLYGAPIEPAEIVLRRAASARWAAR